MKLIKCNNNQKIHFFCRYLYLFKSHNNIMKTKKKRSI